MKKRNIGMILIVISAMLIACSVPASALWRDVPLSDHLESVVWENVTSSALFIDYEGGLHPEQYTYHFDVPAGTEVRTQLCTDVWSANWCGQMDFEFNGCPFGTYQFGTAGSGCGDPICDEHANVAGNGCGGNGVWWDVTGLVTSGAINDFVANRNTAVCTMDGRKRGANIVHLYNDPASDDTLYTWFNQGMEDVPVPDTHIYNVATSVATEWTLHVCIDCGDDYDYFYFNGVRFDWDDTYHGMDIIEYDVTACVQDGTNTIEWVSGDDYFHPFWTVLVGRMPGAVEEPDLVVTDIEFPTMMRPGINQQVTAIVHNQGDASTVNAFNVRLAVDDGTSYNGVITGVGPLGPGASTPVDFTDVSLAAGCHEFNVTADCDDNVGESHENNNCAEENYQVGYVIVVTCDGDFANLVTDPGLPANSVTFDGTTYYIQDLTIENCAGNGILIEGTTVPFVISDCTVQNCELPGGSEISGVYFHDLIGGGDDDPIGRIDNSTVRDNIGRGIRVRNSSYVDIDDNHVYNNTEYGIEVYPRLLGPEEYLCDSQSVEISNNIVNDNYYGIELIGCDCEVEDNIVSDNSWYGIYVFGNDSELFNNTVENNGDYGIKLYNSSGTCVFENTVSNNNGGATQVQASDEWQNHPGYAFNHWNTTIEIGYYHPSGTCRCGRVGNYWSGYGGSDPGNDGIGDLAYQIGFALAAYDYYPLMSQWPTYALVLCGDVNCEFGVNMGDYTAINNYVSSGSPPLTCKWAGDVNCEYGVNMGDYTAVNNYVSSGSPPLDCCDGCE